MISSKVEQELIRVVASARSEVFSESRTLSRFEVCSGLPEGQQVFERFMLFPSVGAKITFVGRQNASVPEVFREQH